MLFCMFVFICLFVVDPPVCVDLSVSDLSVCLNLSVCVDLCVLDLSVCLNLSVCVFLPAFVDHPPVCVDHFVHVDLSNTCAPIPQT